MWSEKISENAPKVECAEAAETRYSFLSSCLPPQGPHSQLKLAHKGTSTQLDPET